MLNEGSMVDKFVNFLNTIKNFISNFFKTIIDKFRSLINKTPSTSTTKDTTSSNKDVKPNKINSITLYSINLDVELDIFNLVEETVKCKDKFTTEKFVNIVNKHLEGFKYSSLSDIKPDLFIKKYDYYNNDEKFKDSVLKDVKDIKNDINDIIGLCNRYMTTYTKCFDYEINNVKSINDESVINERIKWINSCKDLVVKYLTIELNACTIIMQNLNSVLQKVK
jgi:hypothetical protein